LRRLIRFLRLNGNGAKTPAEALNVRIGVAVLAAAGHIRTAQSALVLVGDADAFGAELVSAGFGQVVIERDQGPQDEGRATGVQDDLQPVDEGPSGPTEGAEAGGAATAEAGEPAIDDPRPTTD
jgi:hypothetical protein